MEVEAYLRVIGQDVECNPLHWGRAEERKYRIFRGGYSGRGGARRDGVHPLLIVKKKKPISICIRDG